MLTAKGAEYDKVQGHSDGQEINLTFKEFEFLNYMMENKVIVLTRDKILGVIWSYEFECETPTDTSTNYESVGFKY